MSLAEKLELVTMLEHKLKLQAKKNLNDYCRYIDIPGVPISDNDDCEAFYPDSVTPAKHHELINNILQDVANKTPDSQGRIKKRVMFFMPPGSAKSTYATVVFPTWFMGNHPNKNIICASYGSSLAVKFGRKCRSIARSKKYHDIFKAKLVEDNRAADDWSITNGSTYMAGGILSGITGNRADGLIIDDPIKGREEADSPVIREKIWDEYKSSLRTRLKPNGFIAIIQTRWHEDDLSGRILPENYDGQSGWVTARDGEEWYVVCLQALCEREDDPLGRKIGEWLWTEWFTPAHWKQERITQGSRNWDALYMQKPKPAEGGIFKRLWFAKKRYRIPPANPIMIVQSIDTASKDQEFNDPSAITTWAIAHEGLYLLHVWKDRLIYPDLKRTVKSSYKQWKPNVVLIEDKSSGQELINDLRADRDVSMPIVAIEPEGSKELRAHATSPRCEAGLVWLPEDAEWLIDFESEFFAFPLSTKKDQVDSVTQFLRWEHVRSVGFEAWGSGQARAGYRVNNNDGYSQSQIDEDVGYGIVHGDNDYAGY